MFISYMVLPLLPLLSGVVLASCGVCKPRSCTIVTQSSTTTSTQSTTQSTQSTQVPTTVPTSVPASDFVSWSPDTGTFMLGEDKFVPVGFNAYWLGITEEQEYPSKDIQEEMFKAAVDMGATTIRSHTLGISSGAEKSIRQPGNVINENAWDSIDYAFFLAQEYDIKLICPLLDSYYWYNGNYGDFTDDYGIDKGLFFTDRRTIDDFKEYINIWLNHVNSYTGVSIKDSPQIFAIETGNEFNIRPENNQFPPEDWLIEISDYIRSIDKNHLILHGTDEPLGQSNDFSIDNLDIYTGHFYGEDYSRLEYGASSASAVNKPYIIGEYSSRFDQSWYDTIEQVPNMLGTIVWSMYPHENGNPGAQRIPHEDGFTIWYDTQTEENSNIISLLIDHFERMKN